MMISNPIETTTKPAAGLDAAMLRRLEEKGMIAFTVRSDGSVIKA
jgi:hypothetical protein